LAFIYLLTWRYKFLLLTSASSSLLSAIFQRHLNDSTYTVHALCCHRAVPPCMYPLPRPDGLTTDKVLELLRRTPDVYASRPVLIRWLNLWAHRPIRSKEVPPPSSHYATRSVIASVLWARPAAGVRPPVCCVRQCLFDRYAADVTMCRCINYLHPVSCSTCSVTKIIQWHYARTNHGNGRDREGLRCRCLDSNVFHYNIAWTHNCIRDHTR